MDERVLFTNSWILESATTRRVHERVPEGSTSRRVDLAAVDGAG